MNSLAVHRIIIGILIVALIVITVRHAGPQPVPDGDPSGLDIVSKGKLSLNVHNNGGDPLCLQAAACDVQVEIHYLHSPAPNCTDATASGCPAVDQPRVLPACNTGGESVCFSAAPNPFTLQIQDDDGWRHYDTNGQFVVILNTLSKPRKTH